MVLFLYLLPFLLLLLTAPRPALSVPPLITLIAPYDYPADILFLHELSSSLSDVAKQATTPPYTIDFIIPCDLQEPVFPYSLPPFPTISTGSIITTTCLPQTALKLSPGPLNASPILTNSYISAEKAYVDHIAEYTAAVMPGLTAHFADHPPSLIIAPPPLLESLHFSSAPFSTIPTIPILLSPLATEVIIAGLSSDLLPNGIANPATANHPLYSHHSPTPAAALSQPPYLKALTLFKRLYRSFRIPSPPLRPPLITSDQTSTSPLITRVPPPQLPSYTKGYIAAVSKPPVVDPACTRYIITDQPPSSLPAYPGACVSHVSPSAIPSWVATLTSLSVETVIVSNCTVMPHARPLLCVPTSLHDHVAAHNIKGGGNAVCPPIRIAPTVTHDGACFANAVDKLMAVPRFDESGGDGLFDDPVVTVLNALFLPTEAYEAPTWLQRTGLDVVLFVGALVYGTGVGGVWGVRYWVDMVEGEIEKEKKEEVAEEKKAI